MLEMAFTPSTVLLLAVIAALAALAVRRLTHRGLCDCHDKEGGCAGCAGCAGGSCPSGGCPSQGASSLGLSDKPALAASIPARCDAEPSAWQRRAVVP